MNHENFFMENKGKLPQEKKTMKKEGNVFPNRNENTGRHEPTVSHFAWFFLARRYFQSESARPSREDKDEPCDADII